MIRFKVVSLKNAIAILALFISIIVILLFCADSLMNNTAEQMKERQENSIMSSKANSCYLLQE